MTERRRGRPLSTKKLSNAEIQRRWRAKNCPRSVSVAAETGIALDEIRKLTGWKIDEVFRKALESLKESLPQAEPDAGAPQSGDGQA